MPLKHIPKATHPVRPQFAPLGRRIRIVLPCATPWFIPKLEKAMGPEVKLATKPATTPDGLPYTTYDVDGTAEKNKGTKDLAQKMTAAAETLRNSKKIMGDMQFEIHQRIIREANQSISELRKKCPLV